MSDVDQVAPGYRILRTLGKGMSGTVYLAEQAGEGREVALKVYRQSEEDDRSFARFRREAQLLLAHPHPAIVPILDLDLDAAPPWMALELMAGGDLKDELLRDVPPSVLEVALIGSRIARALAHLHHHGILHRDIKPANLLRDDRGHVYLADLGLGRSLFEDLSITKTGHVVGTPWYMPREAIETGEYSPQGDLFSLGAVLLEFARGRHLEAMASRTATTQQALKEVEDGDLRRILRTCLASRRARRWESGEAMAEAFEDLLAKSGALQPAAQISGETPQRPSEYTSTRAFSSEAMQQLLGSERVSPSELAVRAAARQSRPREHPSGRRAATAALALGVLTGAALGGYRSLTTRGFRFPEPRVPAALTGEPDGRWVGVPFGPVRADPPELDLSSGGALVERGTATRQPVATAEPGARYVDLAWDGADRVYVVVRLPGGGLRLEARHRATPTTLAWSYEHRAAPRTKTRLRTLFVDQQGVAATLADEPEDGAGPTPQRVLLWGRDGTLRLERQGAVRVLAFLESELWISEDDEVVALDRAEGVTRSRFRVTWTAPVSRLRVDPDRLLVKGRFGQGFELSRDGT